MEAQAHSSVSGSRSLRGLIALNAALLVGLGLVTFAGTVQGQNQPQRQRGEYTMVAGDAPGSESSVIYVADVVNQELIALNYNQSTKALDGVGYRNLAADAAALMRSRNRPTN